MEFVMKIGDVVIIPNIGPVIVGVNPEVTIYDTSKLCRIGDNIVVDNGEEKLKFKVLDIDLSCSIWNAVNIGIKIEESKDFIKIKPGNSVYKIV